MTSSDLLKQQLQRKNIRYSDSGRKWKQHISLDEERLINNVNFKCV